MLECVHVWYGFNDLRIFTCVGRQLKRTIAVARNAIEQLIRHWPWPYPEAEMRFCGIKFKAGLLC